MTGEAGIGRTTLLETFARSVAPARTMRVCSGQCLEQYRMSKALVESMGERMYEAEVEPAKLRRRDDDSVMRPVASRHPAMQSE